MPDESTTDLIDQLTAELAADHRRLKHLDEYYEGEQPLKYMAPILQEELGDRITQMVIAWPQMVVDAYETRLDVEGFRLPGDSVSDAELLRIWQANDLDDESPQAHLEALVLGRSYVIIGPGDDPDTPVISVEHPAQVITRRDPRTREVTYGLKRWTGDDDLVHVALYKPERTEYYVLDGGRWVADGENVHGLGIVPVVPLLNKPRVMRQGGRSEMQPILPIADAANKMATDMMVSGEFHAIPRRAWFGMTEEDFVDEHGKPLSVWQRAAGREWATENRKGTEADVVQFPEADLRNFHETIQLLADLVQQVAALPPHYMRSGTNNPASADAIRSSEAQLVKRCERKQSWFGGSWERVMRIAALMSDRSWDGVDLRRIEAVWRDPATPTVAQKADAAVKLYTSGISTLRQTREDVGYTDAQITQMEDDDAQAALQDPVGSIARELAGVRSGDPADAR